MSLDDQLYDIVAKEIRSGTLVDGLYTRAFADANGDKDKAQAKYIKLRVAQLRTEHKGKGKADAEAAAEAEANAKVRAKEARDKSAEEARAKEIANLVNTQWHQYSYCMIAGCIVFLLIGEFWLFEIFAIQAFVAFLIGEVWLKYLKRTVRPNQNDHRQTRHR